MSDYSPTELRSVNDFFSLVEYLREELDWPLEAEDAEDLVFDYEPEELGLDPTVAVKVREIKQIRPLVAEQPWGIFYIDFEPKHLPVVVLRRVLRALVPKKRASSGSAHQAVWNLRDLLFISTTGEEGSRGITFAHFRENEGGGQPRLETFSWDERETHFHWLRNLNLERLRWPEDEDDAEAWREKWANAFTTEHRQVIETSQDLSSELAKFARRTRGLVCEVYEYEAQDGALHRLHDSFRTVLIEDLDVNGFADMVAQTITYGLFSARATGESVLGLSHLEAMVPNTNPFLKELFAKFTSMNGIDDLQIDLDELGVSELVEMLNDTDVDAVLRDFGRQTGGGTQDPVIYFYEHFLTEYDKEQRVRRGEFYTPKPVVSYIVRSVDRILREELDCPDGLADISTMEWNGKTWPKVMILDPATGTGTFLETVIEVIHETMTGKWKREGKKPDEIHAAWNEYVPKHLLPRLHGFELMMAPYSVAHMKLGLKLKETGYEFGSEERLRIFLTNTLEEPQDFSGRLYADFLAHEAEAANRVKREVPVTVVIGNPPYFAGASNEKNWISRLLRGQNQESAVNYFEVDGKSLGERNPRWLNDDYVKFIRYGQWCIERAGWGILSFVTNHSYLDNPTFRGMRQGLMQTFSDIHLLDLHGNTKKKEKTPEGGKDENVFDIQQGVSIGIFAKGREYSSSAVYRADLWGQRTYKYSRLLGENLEGTEWINITVDSPTYLFASQDRTLLAEYQQGWAIKKILPINSVGILTKRDKLTIQWTPDEMLQTVEDFSTLPAEEARHRYAIGKDSRDWKVSQAQDDLQSRGVDAKFIVPVLYRPFDRRYTYYTGQSRGFLSDPCFKTMVHMLPGDNLALITARSNKSPTPDHFLCSSLITELKCGESTIGSSVFPLYLYPTNDNLIDSARKEREPNLAAEFIESASRELNLHFVPNGTGDLSESFGPDDVFRYCYAVFHSLGYRKRYANFLKLDFPRLPLTSDLTLFSELCQWGEELVSLHLMRSTLLDNPFATFPKSGSNVMEKVRYDPEESRVYINKEQCFDNVPGETWNFRVGGYQVLQKWLKDRKGRTLSEEDIEHYKKVVKALHGTSQIMQEIDEVIEAHGGWPLRGSVRVEEEG